MKVLYVVIFSCIFLTACLAPTTRQIKVDDSNVQQERQKQQELALQYLHQLTSRLADTAFPLVQSATVFCEEEDDQVPAIGITLQNEHDYQQDFRETAKSLFGLDEYLRITHVVPGSPADKAGLLSNDRLLSVNSTELPSGKEADKRYREILAELQQDDFPVSVERDGQTLVVQVATSPACDYPVVLSEHDSVNAYADGSRVVITKGMMRFTENDQELALVISHELAHNVMSHIRAKTINSLGGTLLDIAAAVAGVNTQGMFGKMGSQVYSQEFESEADYVGLYIMARADVSIDNAAMFWRRMAVEHPSSINTNHASSHPATAERFISIEKTIEQIGDKQQQGLALMPDMKQ